MNLSIFVSILFVSLLMPTKGQLPQTAPHFESADCPIVVPSERTIECGYLVTKEDNDDPGSRDIKLAVMILYNRNGKPTKEAILYTEGGPGYSSLQSVWWLANTDLGNDRDIVILEQRGNLYSEPSLVCDFAIWSDEKEGQTPCLDHLLKQDIKLDNYTTADIAADIYALKQVVNYESWNLFGSSYSTRLMQIVMDQYPENVRSVVLVSLSPLTDTRYQHDPEHTARALRIMFDDCNADPQCAEDYPDLASEFYTLVREFNQTPINIKLPGIKDNTPFTYSVNGHTLISWMDGSAFYGPAYPPHETAYIPFLIHQLAKGNTDMLDNWVKNYLSRWNDDAFAWGLFFSVNCQDDAPYINKHMIELQVAAHPELAGYYRFRNELDICAIWDLNAAQPLATAPVTSDIPVLILVGTYDPITPPEWGRTAVINLRNSIFIEFPSLGHSVIGNSACARQIISSFINKPTMGPELSCLNAEPAPDFIRPDEIIIAPAMYEIHFGELGYSMLEENLFLISWLTIMATGVISMIASLVKLIRKRKYDPGDIFIRSTLPMLIIFAVTAFTLGYALRWILQKVANSTPVLLRFGLPASYWWLFVVVFLIGLQALGVILITIKSWRNHYWSNNGRIALSLTSLAAVIFCALLVKWGLFTALFR